jgi:8-hydroxy-5-deazaflavin:NADPH oxidoreductase
MDIAVLGAGNMGRAIGTLASHKGHRVVYGVRDAEKARLDLGTGSEVTSIAQAVDDAELVFLAVPYGVVGELVAAVGDLRGKILVDLTNPLTPDYMGLTVGFSSSAAEEIAALAASANVVKAFNTVFPPFFAPATDRKAAAPTIVVAGDDDAAKNKVVEFARSLDFEAVDAGALSNARYIEPMAELGIQLAYGRGLGTQIGFRLNS